MYITYIYIYIYIKLWTNKLWQMIYHGMWAQNRTLNFDCQSLKFLTTKIFLSISLIRMIV